MATVSGLAGMVTGFVTIAVTYTIGAVTDRYDVAIVGGGIMRPIWWGGAAGHLIAVDPTTLAFTSELLLSSTNGWWNFGDAFTLDGRLYTSHQASEFDPTIDPPPYQTQCWDKDTSTWQTCTIDPPPGYCYYRSHRYGYPRYAPGYYGR